MPSVLLSRIVPRPTNGLLFVRLYILTIVVAMGMGISVLMGGANRFSSAAFSGPRELVEWVPGFTPWGVWGFVFLLYGVSMLLVVGREPATRILIAGLILYPFFGISIGKSFVDSPAVSFLGVVLTLAVTAMHAILADYLQSAGWE